MNNSLCSIRWGSPWSGGGKGLGYEMPYNATRVTNGGCWVRTRIGRLLQWRNHGIDYPAQSGHKSPGAGLGVGRERQGEREPVSEVGQELFIHSFREPFLKQVQRDVAHEVFLARPVGAICRSSPSNQLADAEAVKHLLSEWGFSSIGVLGNPSHCRGVVREVMGRFPRDLAIQQVV
jgi:hypothetical protein